MKKFLSLLFSLFFFSAAFAETVKLKNGTFISGSITLQTEYTLNLSTSYGPVVLNQREIEAILPDKHRIFLKGGTQLVGIIIDLDEFNMKLQTEEGTVNIDMPQILSVEVYDYEQGESAQQTIAKKQAEQKAAEEAQAQRLIAQTATANTAVQTQPVQAAGGLTFDSDIEKVFDTKKPEIIKGQVQTVQEISAADIRAQRTAQLSGEEAFLKGKDTSKTQAQTITKTAEAARSGKLEKVKKAEAKKAKRPKDSSSNKYFAISVGAQTNDLKLDNTGRDGFQNEAPYDVGGTAVRAEAAFLWRVKSSNLWLGPSLAIANIPKTTFEDKNPDVINGNNDSLALNGYRAYDPNVSTSGQMIDLAIKANYYFNPDNLFSVYLTANAGYRLLSLNYHGGIVGETINSNSFAGSIGLGVETHVDDLMIGLEIQEFFNTYSKELKDSSSANTVASVKFSWKF